MLKKAPSPRSNPANVQLQTDTLQVREMIGQKRAATAPPDAGGAEQAEQKTNEGPRSPVAQEALELAWKTFADQLPEDGPRSLYTTLLGDTPLISGEVISFKMVNAIQEKDLNDIKGALMEFLRNRLNNAALELQTRVEKQQEVKKEFLSEREKYERLSAKNPLLEELRKRLNLDLT